MKTQWIPLALASTLVMSACGQMPGQMAGQPSETAAAVATADLMAVDYQLIPGGYSVANTEAAGAALEIESVTATSTQSSYFDADYVLDGNLHSAWAPAANDTAPALTLSLKSVSKLSAIALKMSHANVTVDLAVRTAGGAWKTIATGLAPVPTTLSELALEECQADEVKLSFHGADLSELLVCEVQVMGQAGAPVPAPSATPSTPVVTPTEAPTTGKPCTTTGGGWLPVVDKNGPCKISFGYVAETDGADCKGTIVVENLTLKTQYRGVVKALVCKGNFVTFTGLLDNGHTFTVTVVDADRHGKRDSFSFATSGGELFCGYLARSQGGHIQVKHKVKLTLDDLETEHEARADLEDLGVGVVRTHERLDIDLTRFNARCEREDNHEEDAVGRKHKKNKKHD
jgi:hypothetical protein